MMRNEDIPELDYSQDGKVWIWSASHEQLKGILAMLITLFLAHKQQGKCYLRGYEMRPLPDGAEAIALVQAMLD